jgi:hypothetical protein
MSLEFKQTCPEIDKYLSYVKRDIRVSVEELVAEFRPSIDGFCVRMISEFTEEIYEDVKVYFDKVRSQNEEMRKAADEQIEKLEKDLEDLKKGGF